MSNNVRTRLHVLIAEDSEDDALLIVHELRRNGYESQFERVETAADMKKALYSKEWNCILSDYKMPKFSALGALSVLKDSGLDLPFIIISGAIGEDLAVACMKAGAHDYIMKNNMTRLVPAIQREIREAETRAAQQESELALQENELRYRTVVENIIDGILTLDENGIIEELNPAAGRIFGYSSVKIVGSSINALMPGAFGDKHDGYIQKHMGTERSKNVGIRSKVTGTRKNGDTFPIALGISVMFLGNRLRFVCIVRDTSHDA